MHPTVAATPGIVGACPPYGNEKSRNSFKRLSQTGSGDYHNVF